ncbi:MAG TPA: N-carbamoylsarcosine amidohydrolase, partial [Firmicutes bacterium]|nr:N-carbamoylsarcosine amidohydrolase [Bacillota bacterium]
MKDNLLVVVDYQVDFVNGSLGFPLALELEEKIANLIAKKENEGYEVVFTKDEHGDDYLDTEEGKNLPIPHCIKGSGGEEFFGKIKEIASSHKVFIKHT